MKKKSIFTLILTGVASLTSMAAPKPTILSIKETITDNSIVFPESFETDTKKMSENWYLQNYTVLDEEVENKSSNDATDQEYIKRLKAIPSAIEMPYNQIVRKYIEMYVQKRRTLVENMLGMSLYYMPIFEQALEKEGVPLELKYLPVIESALDPEAVSRVGATGLWQFMIGTAKGLGLEVNSLVDERRDPYRSSDKAAKYLKQLHGIYNDWSLAIAAYNCGPNNINKALRRAGGSGKDFWEIYPYLPKETRGYFPAFIAANYVMTYFKYHNISPGLAKKPIVTDTVGVNSRINLNQIAAVLDMPIAELRVLNPQFRRDVIPGDSHPYSLALPSHQIYSFIMSEDSIKNYRSDLYAQRDVVEPSSSRYETSGNGNYTYETRMVTKTHRVGRGETLSSIARKYGVSSSTVKRSNGLRSSKLKRGTVLKIKCSQRVRVPRHEEKQDSEEVLAENDSQQEVEQEELETTDEETTTNTPYAGSYRVSADGTKSRAASTSTTSAKTEKKPATTAKPASAKKESDVATPSKWKTTPQKEKENAEKKLAKNSKSTNSETASTASRSKSKKETAADTKETASTSKKTSISKKNSAKDDTETASTSKKSKKGKTSSRETASGKNVKVKQGESLYEIAQKHGVTVDELKKANKIKGTTIQPGQKLTVPKKKRK